MFLIENTLPAEEEVDATEEEVEEEVEGGVGVEFWNSRF
jgi:hypothetical protein